MIVEEHSMANAFVHVELNTTDTAKAKAFYGKLFDWKMEDMDMGPAGKYTMINPGEGTGGGLWKSQMPGGSFWLAYAIVDDVKTATAKAKSLGASVMKMRRKCQGWAGTASSLTPPVRIWACGQATAK